VEPTRDKPIASRGEDGKIPVLVNGIAREYDYDLSVVIPIYNEEAGIRATVEHLTQYLFAQPWRSEIICVDDGSSDRTAEILEELEEPGRVRAIRSPENRGYGSALKIGFAAAKGRYIGFVDADETYPAKMLGPMLAMLEWRPDVPLVAGSRLLGGGEGLNLLRKTGNLIFTIMSRVVCGTTATDACTGMLLFREELRDELGIEDFTDDLDFSLQMRCRCALLGIPNLELPIPYSDRVGSSKLSAFKHGLKFTGRIAHERLHAKRWKARRPSQT